MMIFKNTKNLMNASGVFSRHPQLLKIWESAGCDAVVTKSITREVRLANKFSYDDEKIILIKGKDWTINSMGLPNKGLEWWKEQLPKYKFKVPLIISIAIDYDIVPELEEFADAFEINVSCPNTEREIIGYNCKSFEETVNICESNKPLIIKLPCYFDKEKIDPIKLTPDHMGSHWDMEPAYYDNYQGLDEAKLLEVLDLLDDLGITMITSQNTVPIKYSRLPTPQGGISGAPIHEIAVKQVQFISDNSNLKIIGCGGIFGKEEADNYWNIKNVIGIQLASGLFKYNEYGYNDPYLFVKNVKGIK